MSPIKVDVALYGSLAKHGNGKHVAQFDMELEPGASKADLLAKLGVSNNEKGYVFINAILCDVPGLTTEFDRPLQDGDHLGIFSIGYMFPYQYRDGAPMSQNLKKALQEHGAMHHTYKNP